MAPHFPQTREDNRLRYQLGHIINEECISSPNDQLLLAVYTITNVIEDHTVAFVFKCNGSYQYSSTAKISVESDEGHESGPATIIMATHMLGAWNKAPARIIL